MTQSFFDYSSAKKKFDIYNKKFPNKVGLIHGSLDKDEKDKILRKFLKKEFSILVSTTVIEVGIDFPNANLIVIENANKFGLSTIAPIKRQSWKRRKARQLVSCLFKEGLVKML